MAQLTEKRMIAAMRRNDRSFDGRFYVGVHSTGIYCLPSCKAKLPMLKNVVFYATREEAIAAGLRGCLRCRSERYPDTLPVWLHQVLTYMREHRNERLNEEKLIRITRVDVSTVRRYFHAHLGTTPLRFHRKIRLQYARELLASGYDFLSAAFECGYESASGFRTAFTQLYGAPPGRFYVQ